MYYGTFPCFVILSWNRIVNSADGLIDCYLTSNEQYLSYRHDEDKSIWSSIFPFQIKSVFVLVQLLVLMSKGSYCLRILSFLLFSFVTFLWILNKLFGIRVAQSGFYFVFCRPLFVFLPLVLCHCIVCPSSFHGFLILLWYFQTSLSYSIFEWFMPIRKCMNTWQSNKTLIG